MKRMYHRNWTTKSAACVAEASLWLAQLPRRTHGVGARIACADITQASRHGKDLPASFQDQPGCSQLVTYQVPELRLTPTRMAFRPSTPRL